MSGRMHETLPQAGDVVMMDATSGIDRIDSKVFWLVMLSPAGAYIIRIRICFDRSTVFKAP